MLKPFQTLKKNSLIGYSKKNTAYYCPGYALEVQLSDKGIMVYVEDVNTHSMQVVSYDDIIIIHPLTELDRECLMPIDEFIECVDCGGITDYDGSGKYSDGVYVYDNVDFWETQLQIAKKYYKYVCWYNK